MESARGQRHRSQHRICVCVCVCVTLNVSQLSCIVGAAQARRSKRRVVLRFDSCHTDRAHCCCNADEHKNKTPTAPFFFFFLKVFRWVVFSSFTPRLERPRGGGGWLFRSQTHLFISCTQRGKQCSLSPTVIAEESLSRCFSTRRWGAIW